MAKDSVKMSSQVSVELKTSQSKPQYRALVGLNYGDTRVEAGEIVSDLPEESIDWLLADGLVEKVEED